MEQPLKNYLLQQKTSAKKKTKEQKEIRHIEGKHKRHKSNHINNSIKCERTKYSNQKADITLLEKKENPTTCCLQETHRRLKEGNRLCDKCSQTLLPIPTVQVIKASDGLDYN